MVSEFKVAPSEAWHLDIVEIYAICDKKTEHKQDASFVINFERSRNGMPEGMFKNKVAQ